MLQSSTSKPKEKKKTLILNTEQVSRILGFNCPAAKTTKILTALSFSVTKQGANLRIQAPSFRNDVNQPVDLIEEIARIIGYDNIPRQLPHIIPQDVQPDSNWGQVKFIKDMLISQGLNEVITYNLISRNVAKLFGYTDEQFIPIANPLTNQQEILRPSIMPGLISCIGYNLNQKQRDIRIFEICNRFEPNKDCKSLELPVLGIAYAGAGYNLLHVKGALQLLLNRLGIEDYEFMQSDYPHPYLQQQASLSLMLQSNCCAHLGLVKQQVLEDRDIDAVVFAAELNLKAVLQQMQKVQKKYTPLPLYPEVVRDISIILRQDIPVDKIIKRLKSENIPFLISCVLLDSYAGTQIPPGHKGITLSCTYRASDYTLTNTQADEAHQKAVNILKQEFDAQQR